MNWKTILGIVALPVIATILWFISAQYRAPEAPAPAAFSHEGNLIQNNPGLEPGAWYLAYEEPGAPGLSVQLLFDHESRCGSEGRLTICNISFDQGQHVKVEGELIGEVVHVTKLTYATAVES